jgi:hypothetical protein
MHADFSGLFSEQLRSFCPCEDSKGNLLALKRWNQGNTAFLRTILTVLLAFWIPSRAAADAGVFTGHGQNLTQISSKSIQLVSIDVIIVPGRGPFLFDGTVPGMDEVHYECSFVLRNLTDKPEEVQVGFPVDSQFARGASKEATQNWILNYGFMAMDDTTTYHVEFVRRKPGKGPNEFGAIFVWKMNFAPRESKTLKLAYHIPMSMGLVSTERDELNSSSQATGALAQELVGLAQMEMVGYITSTGSSWSGNVEKATFTVYTEPFERYFERRGITEENAPDLSPEEAETFRSSFPVQHPWWFRQITPGGWHQIKGGIQWQYENFKPKDSIELRYYMTQLPSREEEVGRFLDQVLRHVGPTSSPTVELEKIKQILLATYGEEPQDSEVRAFAGRQLWYAPRKDFSRDKLSPAQAAILHRIDERIASFRAKN